MKNQAMRSLSVDFADTDYIQFKYGGKMYEYDDVDNDYLFVRYIESYKEDWTASEVLELHMIEDLAATFMKDNFDKLPDLLKKSKIVSE